jgi:hypothetical protein
MQASVLSVSLRSARIRVSRMIAGFNDVSSVVGVNELARRVTA